MKMTGHSDYDAMKPYIEVADDTVKVEMLKWEADPIKNKIIAALDSASPEQMKKALKVLTTFKS